MIQSPNVCLAWRTPCQRVVTALPLPGKRVGVKQGRAGLGQRVRIKQGRAAWPKEQGLCPAQG